MGIRENGERHARAATAWLVAGGALTATVASLAIGAGIASSSDSTASSEVSDSSGSDGGATGGDTDDGVRSAPGVTPQQDDGSSTGRSGSFGSGSGRVQTESRGS